MIILSMSQLIRHILHNRLAVLFSISILFFLPSVFAQEETSEDFDFFLTEGNDLLNSSNYEDAILSYDKVLAIDPNQIEALAKKGDALAKLGKIKEAIPYIFKVIDIDSGFADEQGNLYLDKFLELDPNNLELLYQKAKSTMIFFDKLDEAISYLDKILEIQPNHANALYGKGEVYFQQDKFEDAIKFYDKTLEIEPDNADALSGKGYALAKLDDFENSNIFLERALELAPDNPDVLYKKGSALLVQGNADDAFTYFYDAQKIDPDHFLSEIKFNFVEKHISYKKFDGFVDTMIYDSQDYLVGHVKVRDLRHLDHEIFYRIIDEWPVTKIINRDGVDYEVRQHTEEYEVPYRNWEGGVYRYGIYFSVSDSKFEILSASHWLYHVEEGDHIKVIRTFFQPV